MRRASIIAGFVLVSLAHPTPSAAQEDGSQVIVIRSRRRTTAKVNLVPGDHAAVLVIHRPPPRVMQRLQEQLGPAVIAVERIDLVGDTLRVALLLKSRNYRTELKRMRRRRGDFAVTFIPSFHKPVLTTRAFLGRVPGTPPLGKWPVVLPKTPTRHPCDRFDRARRIIKLLALDDMPDAAVVVAYAKMIKDEHCSKFLIALTAAQHLERGLPVSRFKNWAYQLSRDDRWDAHPYPYSFAALTAAAVLLEHNYRPEAEILLATDRIQKSDYLLTYRAMFMSDLLAADDRKATSIRILRSVISKTRSPEMHSAAATRLVDLLANEDLSVARKKALKLSKSGPVPADPSLLTRAGEYALSVGDWRSARKLFTTTAQARSRRLRSHAMLRLGDLEIIADRRRTKKKAIELYSQVDKRQACLSSMVALRTALLNIKDPERIENILLAMIKKPFCAGQALEARYAMARLSAWREHYDYALALLEEAKDLHENNWGSRRTFAALAGEIANESTSRLHRERNWDGLAQLFATRLSSRQHMLRSDSCLHIAKSLSRVGLHEDAIRLIHDVLKRKPAPPNVDDLTIALANLYLAGGQDYRAEIVLEYFRRTQSRSEKAWMVALARAEILLRQGNGIAAVSALRAAEKSTPRGDPMQRMRWLLAEAQYELDRPEAAAKTLLTMLKREWLPPLQKRGLGVNVLSACVRKCQPKTLERLLKAFEVSGHGALISERLRYLSAQRGVGRRPDLEESSVWRRLEAADDTSAGTKATARQR